MTASCDVGDLMLQHPTPQCLRRPSKSSSALRIAEFYTALSVALRIMACTCCYVDTAAAANSVFRNYNKSCLPPSTTVLEYCNLPEYFTNGVEGQAPPGHRLLKAFVLARHGSRHVMHHTRFGPLAQPRQSCRLKSDVLVADGDVRLPSLLASFIRDVGRGFRQVSNSSMASATPSWSYPPAPGVALCGHAHLTPLGVAQHLRVGLALRDAYEGQLNLTNVYVRSTDTRRTYQSAVALLYGLLGSASAAIPIKQVDAHYENFCDESTVAHFVDIRASTSSSFSSPTYSVSSSNDETLAAAAATARSDASRASSICSCPSVKRLKMLARAELKEQLRPADRAYERFLSAALHVFRGPERAKPEYPWKRALDHAAALSLCSRRGRGPLPCFRGRCFVNRDVDDLWTHLSEYFASMSLHETFARKSRIEMQPFLWDVLQLANSGPSAAGKSATAATAPKAEDCDGSGCRTGCGTSADAAATCAVQELDRELYVYSGHDVTITALALALGMPFRRWPPYASTLVLEVYERLSDGSRHLRALYAGHDVTEQMRFFRAPSRRLCPWEAFAEFALSSNLRELGYDSWLAACSS